MGLWVFAALVACSASPADQVAHAQAAAEDEDLDAYLLVFTMKSGDMLRRMHETKVRTRGEITYLDDVLSLVPQGEITNVEEDGEVATVTVESEKGLVDLRCLRQDGSWRIDATSLAAFWQPLKGRP